MFTGIVAAVGRIESVSASEGGVYVTQAPIVADVKADETGVYVASTDTRLYCLDRQTGRRSGVTA